MWDDNGYNQGPDGGNQGGEQFGGHRPPRQRQQRPPQPPQRQPQHHNQFRAESPSSFDQNTAYSSADSNSNHRRFDNPGRRSANAGASLDGVLDGILRNGENTRRGVVDVRARSDSVDARTVDIRRSSIVTSGLLPNVFSSGGNLSGLTNGDEDFMDARRSSAVAENNRRISALENRRSSAVDSRSNLAGDANRFYAAENRRSSAAENRRSSAAENRRSSAAENRRSSAAENRRSSAAETRRSSAAETRRSSAADSRRSSAAETRRSSAAYTRRGTNGINLRSSVGSEGGRSYVDSDFSDGESEYSTMEVEESYEMLSNRNLQQEQQQRQRHRQFAPRAAPMTKNDDRDALNNIIQKHRRVLGRRSSNAEDVYPPDNKKTMLSDGRGSVITPTSATLTRDSSWRSSMSSNVSDIRRQRKFAVGLYTATLLFSLVAATYLGNGRLGIVVSDWFVRTIRGNDDEEGGPKTKRKDGRGRNYYGADEIDTEPWRDLDKKIIVLPPLVERNFADVDKQVPMGTTVTPFFWKIPKSGGNVVSLVMTKCLSMVEASDAGKGHDDETTLQIYSSTRITKSGPLSTRHVNVDTSTVDGIERARRQFLVPSGLADVVISTFFYETASLFDSPNQSARAIALVRHPIHRAEGIYKSMSSSLTMDVPEYFSPGSRQYVEDNWMVRTLANRADGTTSVSGPGPSVPPDDGSTSLIDANRHLEAEDLLLAMEVLRKKFIVGLVDDVDGSIQRFREYFGWNDDDGNGNGGAVDECVSYLTKPSADKNRGNSTGLVEGSPEWNIILTYNKWDLQLYNYARILYEEQGRMIKQRRRRRR